MNDMVKVPREFDAALAKEVLVAYMAGDSQNKIKMDFNLTGGDYYAILNAIRWRITGEEWNQIAQTRRKSGLDFMAMVRADIMETVHDFLKG